MKSLKEVSLGFLSAIASTVIIMGAILVAMTEGIALSVPTIEPTNTLPAIVQTLMPGESSPTSLPSPTQARPVVVTITPTPPCPVPAGWEQYPIQSGDRLSKLAAERGISVQDLMKANCLKVQVESLQAGTSLYLPPLPSPTFTVTVTFTRTFTPTLTLRPSITTCSPPSNWVRYVVQSGDTLYRLSLAVGISNWRVLMTANCLKTDQIVTGDIIYLPRLPALTPTFTATTARPAATTRVPSRTPSRTPTRTPPTPPTTTLTPTATPTATNSPTATPTATELPTPTPTNTLEPTTTPTATLEPPPPPPG
jgi:LysM repeat protein